MKTVRDFSTAKDAGRKIAMVTAYDAAAAGLIADSAVDCILVGDSVMMVVHGEENTQGATPELMALHTRAVARGRPGKFIVADMPYRTASQGNAVARTCAQTLIAAGADAVKIEGAAGHEDVIRHLIAAGVPVMGHLGLLPQSVKSAGDFKVQAKTVAAAAQLRQEASVLESLGVFAIVLECIPAKLAAEITAAARVPTIGIGAGPDCDGQVLVWHDFLGLNPAFQARFVRRFCDGAGVLSEGLAGYARAVQTGAYPTAKESF